MPGRACDAAARLAAQFDFDTAEIDRIADLASAGHASPPACTALWRASVAFARPRLNGLAQRIEPRATWNDLVLPPDTIAAPAADRRAGAAAAPGVRALGLARADPHAGSASRALFAGESGTGKTMAAEVLADELRLDLYRIDLSRSSASTSARRRRTCASVFDAAERGGAMLLFDEADALFGKRSEVKDSHDRYANIEIELPAAAHGELSTGWRS